VAKTLEPHHDLERLPRFLSSTTVQIRRKSIALTFSTTGVSHHFPICPGITKVFFPYYRGQAEVMSTYHEHYTITVSSGNHESFESLGKQQAKLVVARICACRGSIS
jgi:hypothetical protein